MRTKPNAATRTFLTLPLPVVILTTSDAQPLDVAGPYEVFALAERKPREMEQENGAGYDVELVTMGRSRYITGRLGLSIVAKGSYKTVTGDIDPPLVVGDSCNNRCGKQSPSLAR
jgi:hypothetical protein